MADKSSPHRPNGLVAIILVTRSRPGPKIVFHYPPDPQIPKDSRHFNEFDDSDSSSDDTDRERRRKASRPRHGSSDATVTNTNNRRKGRSRSSEVADGKLLGYSHDGLEALLSPGRWCERRKFEVCLDGLTFLGHPIFALEDGKWSKSDKPTTAARPAPQIDLYNTGYDYYDIEAFQEGIANITVTAPEATTENSPKGQGQPIKERKRQNDFSHYPDSFESKMVGASVSLGTSFNSGSTSSAILGEQMNMFHLVLVLSSAGGDHIDAAYESVVKPLNNALHHCQKRNQYVAKEALKIQASLTKARNEALPPAAAWAQLAEISELAWALREVFERISKDQVAAFTLNGTPFGLHLQGSDRILIDADIQPHDTLLLLEDKETLLRQLSASTVSDNSPLAHFIRGHMPTKPISKTAARTGMPFQDLQYLARHLLNWRKARVVPSLHPRNIYVISPSAPIDTLAERNQEYNNRFPALPNLGRMLKALGGKPVPYWVFIPSKDHRPVFMEILEWLIRWGFVAQWRSVGWLKIPDHAFMDTKNSQARHQALSLPYDHLLEDDTGSVSSDRTAVPISPSRQAQDGVKHPSTGSGPPDIDVHSLQELIPDQELREHLPKLIQHFDGKCILEEIAVKEQWKRVKVDLWLEMLEKQDLLLRARML
ncbi:hypothetical protein K431DRAFT_232490 [Polychaeton citri CBS 116435]|uniref:Nitrogen permease regulator 3 n=1 Tax=Polychaeton citri CBS 116435 TaxID=1314669 RepID=A0A9P4Q1E1_9PEZI|nr:hypothetical protein K431DRAFT_232490 [Polychaeton citri CBS 116435]